MAARVGPFTLGWLPSILASLAFALPALAQEATLRGTVRDSQGKPVAGALIRLQAQAAAPAVTAQTDSHGSYRFDSLESGVYGINAEMKGYAEASISSMFLGPHESKTVDLTLTPAKAETIQAPAFYDQPQFTVAGVTDTTSLGGHGSDTVTRTRDSLAKKTVSLGKSATASAPLLERKRSLVEEIARKPDDAYLHHQLAEVEEELGDPLSAVREYQRAADLDPSESYLFDWGSELLLHHAPEPAIEVFTKANHLFPRSARLLLGLGAALFALGNDDQAVQRVGEACDLNPADATPYLFLGTMLSAETTPSDLLVDELRRFAALQPENAKANYYYATALWKLRKDSRHAVTAAQVETLLNKSVGLDPKLGPAYIQLGILHFEQRDYSRAIADYRQAIQLAPEMEDAHYRLAQAYRQIGESEKAKSELQAYEQMAKKSAENQDRERREIRQFVYTLRRQAPAQIQ